MLWPRGGKVKGEVDGGGWGSERVYPHVLGAGWGEGQEGIVKVEGDGCVEDGGGDGV